MTGGSRRDQRRLQVGAADLPEVPDTEELPAAHLPEPVVPEVLPVEVLPPSRPRRPRGLAPQEIGVVVVLVVVLAVIGIVVAALAQGDDEPVIAVPSTTTTLPRPTTTTSTTAPPIDDGADATLTAQVRKAVDAEEPGAGAVVSGVYLNLLGNMKVDTNLGDTRASAERALVICLAGKSLGYTDVEVRSGTGKDLASTGLLDNRCSRRR